MSDDFRKAVARSNKYLSDIARVEEVALPTILQSFNESDYEIWAVEGEERFVHWFSKGVNYIDSWQRLESRNGVTDSRRFIYEMRHVNNYTGRGDVHCIKVEHLNIDDFEEDKYAGNAIWQNFVYAERLYWGLANDNFLKEHGFRPLRQWKTVIIDGEPVVKASHNRFREVVDKAW